MIIRLDLLVTDGHGDEQYQEMFYEVYGLLSLFNFVKHVAQLLTFSCSFFCLPVIINYILVLRSFSSELMCI
jgi:hypothetical protein